MTETVRLYVSEATNGERVSSVALLERLDLAELGTCCVISNRVSNLPIDVDQYRVRLQAFRASLEAIAEQSTVPREVRVQLITDGKVSMRDLHARLEGFEKAHFVLAGVFEERDNPVLKLLRDGAETLCDAPSRADSCEQFANRVLDRIERQAPQIFHLEEATLTKIAPVQEQGSEQRPVLGR